LNELIIPSHQLVQTVGLENFTGKCYIETLA